MALFKILKGDSSRIDMAVTPFHEGYAYFTPDDGGFYIDSVENGEPKRIRVTAPGSGGFESSAVYGTLLAKGWINSQQKLAVDGLKASQNGVIGVTQDVTDEQLRACREAGLYICGQEDGFLTIALSGDTPVCDIPVVIILLN